MKGFGTRFKCLIANRYTRVAMAVIVLGTVHFIFGIGKQELSTVLVGLAFIALGLFVLWNLRFGRLTEHAYRTTKRHYRNNKGLKLSFLYRAYQSAYCYEVGVNLAVQEICKDLTPQDVDRILIDE